jgi:hypothetical protein
MPNLGPMVLLHSDGTESHFFGARLKDDPPYLNRFIYRPNRGTEVILSFDDLKRHKHWICSCGGKSIPFHCCPHIVYLEISTTDAENTFVLTEDEFKVLSGTPLEDIDFDMFGNALGEQIKKTFPSVFKDDFQEPEPPVPKTTACPEFLTFFGGAFCQDCGHLEADHERKGTLDWTGDHVAPIPKTKLKRIFADKDEDV